MLVGRVKAAGLPLLLVAAAGHLAWAHVAPSRDANNRYLRATLLPTGVRLSFTLLWGELPGAAERRRMDADGDGTLSDAEKRQFGERLTAELAPRLPVSLDGKPAGPWKLSDVGTGSPRTEGGTFAIDLTLDAAYADPSAPTHQLSIDDRTALPFPGEVELRIDESPGVRLSECHLAGERTGIETTFAFTGNAAAPGDRAVTARFSVDEKLRPRPRRNTAVLGAAGTGVLAVLIAALVKRRRRKRAT